MSLNGEIHKSVGDIREAINKIAKQGILGLDGMPIGTKKIMGYVCAINEEGELAGTIDVQEFNYEPGEYSIQGVGHHRGVLLSAIQNNEDGVLIVPQLYSDVVIVQNPYDGKEYVLMYSHAKKIQWQVHSNKSEDNGVIQIGVTEVEDFNETNDGLDKDFNELEQTKNKSLTRYKSKEIFTQVSSPENEDGFQETTTYNQRKITVGDTEIIIEKDSISIKTTKQVYFQIGSTKITEEDGQVNIETQKCNLKGTQVEVNGSQVTITGGQLQVQGQSSVDMNGPFNPIKACPFSGAPHCGSIVAGT